MATRRRFSIHRLGMLTRKTPQKEKGDEHSSIVIRHKDMMMVVYENGLSDISRNNRSKYVEIGRTHASKTIGGTNAFINREIKGLEKRVETLKYFQKLLKASYV